jgi:dephospho-CoA kinase
MFIVGLTGSVGMGKSVTAKFFAEEGVPVHDADAAVHRLYEGKAVAPIEAAFPGTTADGKVDRVKLASRVLGDPAALLKLEQLVHPTGAEKRCNAVVVVSAPQDMQRERVLARPGMTPKKFIAILAKQMPDAEKRARADFIVDSGQGFDAARAQVREILAQVSRMATH